MVVITLNRKTSSLESLVAISVEKRLLARVVQRLTNSLS